MPPRETLVVTCPLESVRPLGRIESDSGRRREFHQSSGDSGSLLVVHLHDHRLRQKAPVWAVCFPPLDSTIAAPNAVALGSRGIV